jgi:hypothetical protein
MNFPFIKPIMLVVMGFLFFQIQAQSFSKNTKKGQLIEKASLGKQLEESSGMICWRGLFWQINDSGGEAEIYAFDTVSKQVIQTIKIENATNIDWEEIAQDKTHIYIGDFGE